MDTDHLRELIAADRSNGLTPIVVIGTAGTVATGAIDDLSTLADICAKERLWLHVDGAFGAIAALSDKLRPRVKGMERADSLAFDLHKWMSVNYDAGCVLVRKPEAHMKSFSIPARSFSISAAGPKPLIRTLAPSLAKARAMPSPMPEVEPVMTAFLPLSI